MPTPNIKSFHSASALGEFQSLLDGPLCVLCLGQGVMSQKSKGYAFCQGHARNVKTAVADVKKLYALFDICDSLGLSESKVLGLGRKIMEKAKELEREAKG